MASRFETSIRLGLEKLHIARNDIDDLIDPDPVPFSQAPNILVAYPGFMQWLLDFDDHTPKQLTHDLHILRFALERYRQMKSGYEFRIKRELRMISARRTGNAILNEIRASSGRTVSIQPYLANDDDDYNADVEDRDDAGATAKGMPILDKYDRTIGSGSGEGSDVDLNFSPEIWGVYSESPLQRGRYATPAKPTGPASQPDEVLFHELVHSGRDLRGVSYTLAVTQHYGNEEEFLAVVITNIYLAEKGQVNLRDSHMGHQVLAHPEKFLDNVQNVNPSPRRLLERFRGIQPCLFESLASINVEIAWFNPVQDYKVEVDGERGHGCKPKS
jgi:hypothetical protein